MTVGVAATGAAVSILGRRAPSGFMRARQNCLIHVRRRDFDWMRLNPTVTSMREHLESVREFDQLARDAPSIASAMRRVNAAIYSLRACVDNLRSAAKRGALTLPPRALDDWLDANVPRLRLVRKLRNYHFHEEAVYGPPRMRVALTIVVPALSTAAIGLTVNHASPQLSITNQQPGSATFFLISGLLVQDEHEPEPVPIPLLLRNLPLELEARWPELEAMFRPAPA